MVVRVFTVFALCVSVSSMVTHCAWPELGALCPKTTDPFVLSREYS